MTSTDTYHAQIESSRPHKKWLQYATTELHSYIPLATSSISRLRTLLESPPALGSGSSSQSLSQSAPRRSFSSFPRGSMSFEAGQVRVELVYF